MASSILGPSFVLENPAYPSVLRRLGFLERYFGASLRVIVTSQHELLTPHSAGGMRELMESQFGLTPVRRPEKSILLFINLAEHVVRMYSGSQLSYLSSYQLMLNLIPSLQSGLPVEGIAKLSAHLQWQLIGAFIRRIIFLGLLLAIVHHGYLVIKSWVKLRWRQKKATRAVPGSSVCGICLADARDERPTTATGEGISTMDESPINADNSDAAALIPVSNEWQKFACGHYFHASCAMKWLARDNVCPLCRREDPLSIGSEFNAFSWRQRLWEYSMFAAQLMFTNNPHILSALWRWFTRRPPIAYTLLEARY